MSTLADRAILPPTTYLKEVNVNVHKGLVPKGSITKSL